MKLGNILSSIGGIIWSYLEIKKHWEHFKIHGRGW